MQGLKDNIPLIIKIGLQLTIFIFIAVKDIKIKNPMFLVSELAKQASLLYFVVGTIYLLILLNFITVSESIIVPVAGSILAYILCFVMSVKQTSKCPKPNYTVAATQSFKPFFFVLLAYFSSKNMKWMQQGFFDTVNDGKFSPLGLYTAVCFWMTSAILPSVTMAYFGTERYACNTETDIHIKDIDEMKYT